MLATLLRDFDDDLWRGESSALLLSVSLSLTGVVVVVLRGDFFAVDNELLDDDAAADDDDDAGAAAIGACAVDVATGDFSLRVRGFFCAPISETTGAGARVAHRFLCVCAAWKWRRWRWRFFRFVALRISSTPETERGQKTYKT